MSWSVACPSSAAAGQALAAGAEHPAGTGPGVLALVDGQHAVHHDVAHAFGIVMRIGEGGPIGDDGPIEDRDVGGQLRGAGRDS